MKYLYIKDNKLYTILGDVYYGELVKHEFTGEYYWRPGFLTYAITADALWDIGDKLRSLNLNNEYDDCPF
jgi:hypothetical protein